MSEIRRDPVSNRWIVIAPELFEEMILSAKDRFEPNTNLCPFCPGNEAATPQEILAFGPADRLPNSPGWSVRVFPSRTPALRPEGAEDRQGKGIFDFMNALGAHEVVVNGPDHHGHLATLSREQITLILKACRDRINDLFGDRRLHYVMIFIDHGKSAGQKLGHSCSQIVAVPKVPPSIEEELRGAKQYYDLKERCVFCDILMQEVKMGIGFVCENDHFVAFCPFASRFPYEVWLLPKEHQMAFGTQSDAQLQALSGILQAVAIKLDAVLGEPDYHMVLHTAPNLAAKPGYWQTVPEDYHWHIEFIPRVFESATYEWGAGYYVNSVAPERAALALRTPH